MNPYPYLPAQCVLTCAGPVCLLCPAALCLLYLAQAHADPKELGMGEAVALLTATLSIGGFQSAGFASNHQVRLSPEVQAARSCNRTL